MNLLSAVLKYPSLLVQKTVLVSFAVPNRHGSLSQTQIKKFELANQKEAVKNKYRAMAGEMA